MPATSRLPRPQREVRNHQQRQDQEGTRPHRPPVADLVDQPAEHDGEHHASHARARRYDAEGQAAARREPPGQGANGRQENYGHADGAADALAEQELVILRRKGGHHQPKDMHEGAAEHEQAEAVAVVDVADYGAQDGHEEDLEGGDPGDRAGGVGG